MSQTIEQYKKEKEQLEKQIADMLATFCTTYNALLHMIELEHHPRYAKGSNVWTGGKIELHLSL